jgi:hypothetical protein
MAERSKLKRLLEGNALMKRNEAGAEVEGGRAGSRPL